MLVQGSRLEYGARIIQGCRRVFKVILMGLRVEAERKHPFAGAKNVGRTEILYFTLLPKNRLLRHNYFYVVSFFSR